MKGLPGSGKSTVARELVAKDGTMIRVNRDDLRKMLHGDANWSKGREAQTVAAEMSIARTAILSGTNVLVDDTNILGKGVQLWYDFANSLSELDVDIKPEVIDMTDVPLSLCVAQDTLRSGSARVGRGVIERMALFGGLIDLSKAEKVAVVDIDGTLADLDHRLVFLQSTPKDYKGFFDWVNLDGPFRTVWQAVRTLKDTGHTVIILSGRPASTGYASNEWLSARVYQTEGLDPLNHDHLFMRQTGDHRPDDQVKRQLMNTMFEKAGLRKEAIKVVIDDRDSVCAVWREMGLPLIQVDHGTIVRIEPSSFRMAQMLQIPINSGEMPADQDKPTTGGTDGTQTVSS